MHYAGTAMSIMSALLLSLSMTTMSVFNHMIRLDIHVPENLHTVCLCDRFGRLLVPLFGMLYVICFTETTVDTATLSCLFLYSSWASLLHSLIMCHMCDCLFSVFAHPACCFTFLHISLGHSVDNSFNMLDLTTLQLNCWQFVAHFRFRAFRCLH